MTDPETTIRAALEQMRDALALQDAGYYREVSPQCFTEALAALDLLVAERDALATAARAFESGLSEYCDGPERDALRAALRKEPQG